MLLVSCKDDPETIAIPEITLAGKYRGTWNDNFYSNFAVSTELKLSADSVLTGPFYYKGSFTPCCGGPDDGSVSMKIKNGAISSFMYEQRLITFMNGCNGIYTGSGKVSGAYVLEIDFTGEDCEGIHTGGKIVLTKAD